MNIQRAIFNNTTKEEQIHKTIDNKKKKKILRILFETNDVKNVD